MTIRKVPRKHIDIRFKVEVHEMARQGAAYHRIKWQSYIQWLVEEALKAEAKYYGWATLTPRYKVQGPTKIQEKEIQRLMAIARRKMARCEQP